jgi:hypothetical protein
MMAGDARSDELEERKAALPARKGSNAVAGFAVQTLAAGKGIAEAAATNLAEPLRPQSSLSQTWLRQKKGKASGVRSGESRCGVAAEGVAYGDEVVEHFGLGAGLD